MWMYNYIKKTAVYWLPSPELPSTWRWEVSLSISARTDRWLYHAPSGPHWGCQAIIKAFKDPKMSQQDETRDINNSSGIWNKEKAWKWQKSKRSYGSYNIGLSTVCGMKKWKDQLWSFMASSACVQDDLKWQTLKVPKLAQLDKELYMCFTAVHSEGNPVTSFDNW